MEWTSIRGARPDDAARAGRAQHPARVPVHRAAGTRAPRACSRTPARACWSPTGRTAWPASSTCTCSALVEADPFGEVGSLVVAAPRRGAGLGFALLAAAADWSRARGLERLWIRANLARVGPHEFYEAIGCRAVKDQRVYEYPL